MSKQPVVESVTSAVASYDSDFFEWTQQTAELIRQGRLQEADLEHVAEEIADMGKRDRREVRSQFVELLMHLLKWQLQPTLRGTPSWRATIVKQRQQLALVLEDSPSLRRVPEKELSAMYKSAVVRAIAETGLARSSFPASCPFSVRETIDPHFFPE
jgi:hypothetical protein